MIVDDVWQFTTMLDSDLRFLYISFWGLLYSWCIQFWLLVILNNSNGALRMAKAILLPGLQSLGAICWYRWVSWHGSRAPNSCQAFRSFCVLFCFNPVERYIRALLLTNDSSGAMPTKKISPALPKMSCWGNPRFRHSRTKLDSEFSQGRRQFHAFAIFTPTMLRI